MTGQFADLYAQAYDSLYADKNYAEEADYVARTIRTTQPVAQSILEFGSGTGRHARLMTADGFEIVGIEQSAAMIDRARSAPMHHVRYVQGDIRTLSVGQTFDVVMALFHVVSYLNSNDDILSAFRNARRHLAVGGLFVFDFWYGPAVLTCRPEARIKEIATSEIELTRFASTSLDVNSNTARVQYSLHLRTLKDGIFYKERETHTMRYLFLPELSLFLGCTGFRFEHAEEWLTGRPLDATTWNGLVVATAVPL